MNNKGNMKKIFEEFHNHVKKSNKIQNFSDHLYEMTKLIILRDYSNTNFKFSYIREELGIERNDRKKQAILCKIFKYLIKQNFLIIKSRNSKVLVYQLNSDFHV